tara:strand:+ start:281 stop:751 length:471 start_codon:yes stop_codon:yes gene_type:complete
MHKLLIIVIFILLSSCNIKPVHKTHGVPYLDKKEKKLFLNKTNKNDALLILGPPSTKSTFDNTIWIYIERIRTKGGLFKFGRNITTTNNVLVLNFNTMGLLKSKEFYDLEKINKIKFVKNTTPSLNKEQDFIYSFLSSIRQKVDNPTGKKKRRRSN